MLKIYIPHTGSNAQGRTEGERDTPVSLAELFSYSAACTRVGAGLSGATAALTALTKPRLGLYLPRRVAARPAGSRRDHRLRSVRHLGEEHEGATGRDPEFQRHVFHRAAPFVPGELSRLDWSVANPGGLGGHADCHPGILADTRTDHDERRSLLGTKIRAAICRLGAHDATIRASLFPVESPKFVVFVSQRAQAGIFGIFRDRLRIRGVEDVVDIPGERALEVQIGR